MKTIKQIADEIGVTKQAVHQKRKSKLLSTALQPFTSTVEGVVYISVDGENLIKSAFSAIDRKHVYVNEPSTVDGHVDAIISMLQRELEVKNEQITIKDTQITDLQTTINNLLDRLAAAQASEQAAQILHASTIKRLADSDEKRGWWQFWKKDKP